MALELPQPALDNCLKVGAGSSCACLLPCRERACFLSIVACIYTEHARAFEDHRHSSINSPLLAGSGSPLCRAPAFVRLRAEGRAPAAVQRHAAPCAWLGVPYTPPTPPHLHTIACCARTRSHTSSISSLRLPCHNYAVLLPRPANHPAPALPRPRAHQGVYRAFCSNAKFVNAASLPQINFMGAAVIEMYGINPSECGWLLQHQRRAVVGIWAARLPVGAAMPCYVAPYPPWFPLTDALCSVRNPTPTPQPPPTSTPLASSASWRCCCAPR